jgi:DNA primase
VRPQVGYYHCFGCGESGDVYSFLRAMDHLSFTEAVERLAARIGYTLHYEDGGAAPETSGRTRLYQANTAAAEWFRGQLSSPEADAGRRFLGERGFDAGAAAHFGVGYAPKGWDHLRDAMRAQGFSDEELSAAGLVSQGQRGVYDRFRGRVVWPIRDVTGQTIGFGARRLYDDDKGPSTSTPPRPRSTRRRRCSTAWTSPRRTSRARTASSSSRATPTSWRAISPASRRRSPPAARPSARAHHRAAPRHGRRHGGGEVVFTFDPDAAGQKAALRAFADAKRFNAQTYVATGPQGLDPAICAWNAATRRCVPCSTPRCRCSSSSSISVFRGSTSRPSRVASLRAAAPSWGAARPAAAPEYTRVLARRLGMDTEDVRREVDRAARDSARREGDAHRPTSTASATPRAPTGPRPHPWSTNPHSG